MLYGYFGNVAGARANGTEDMDVDSSLTRDKRKYSKLNSRYSDDGYLKTRVVSSLHHSKLFCRPS